MHVIFISACEKRAIKKTRAILDSYAIRTGQSSWQAPMTMEGLKEIRTALKRTATRQTAVAAYVNYGMRRMKLVWIVGSKTKFGADGAYPVASTRKQQKQLQIQPWVRVASLLAGAAGDVHDIGKASIHFQNKLKSSEIIKDEVRHEWLSMKLLQNMRKNNWHWQDAWNGIENNISELSLGDRTKLDKQSILNELEAVDFLVVSHHGLLGASNLNPNASLHVRTQTSISNPQITCAGDIDQRIFKSHQARMTRVQKLIISDTAKSQTYWKALTLHARAALIFADHTVSAREYSNHTSENVGLFANSKLKKHENGDLKRSLDQPLDWHLQNVGDRASYLAVKMMTDLNLTGLSEQSVEYICQPARNERFNWQNKVANALQKQMTKHPDIPSLIFNIAGTGSGKTRMNLRAACILRPNDPRIAIALNLRSLTLQTGEALKSSMNLSEDEIAVIIGDKVTQQLFNQRSKNDEGIDDDENLAEPIFDSKWGEGNTLPEWLNPLYQKTSKGRTGLDRQAQTVLASPLLVSTIDYLIAAGEPHRQGHHVKALLRLMSSDLILDEIDGYEPKSLIAVLRLVQLSAMYGRNVICSSATLSETVAKTIYRAYESGIEMREALNAQPEQNNCQKFLVAITDNELNPKIWVQDIQQHADFDRQYQQHLNDLQTVLTEKARTPYRIAKLATIEHPNVDNWKKTILESVQSLHTSHGWNFKNTDKKLSFGLVRVANIKHAIALAKYLSVHLSHARIACYHANDWLISRFYKEQRLDFLLTRHPNKQKRLSGNEHILQDEEINTILKNSESDDVPFIVIATPVEEVGRDHDFDWAVIDASSIQSIVQTAGRVNRHRLNLIDTPNIVIPQFNYRYCENNDQPKKQKKAVFKWPGYEAYGSSSKEHIYKIQDIEKLIPWNTQHEVVINACLRFDQNSCKFAEYDDAQIQKFCEDYFYPSKFQYFANSKVPAFLLAEEIYDETALRDIQKQEVYIFDVEDDDLKIKHTDLHHVQFDPETGKYIPSIKTVSFIVEEAPQNAWLANSPAGLVQLCREQNIQVEEGCKVSLAVYPNQVPEWIYHYGFGIYSE
ncbi:type I-F CRISPR-associated helicase Cas3f [Acinetobacter stercoris]|uniref:CRISPR-associated nuclease/helicase Cas3 subtype I-F/YPEST n=1 Tax=Acinetobacter stercoris TaxID=2126983 RepID=A0A2U3MUP7_9GAMM|nr:type I-F CRISPR-associated helicase Cas3f [Acinetobacter stercoris]SPL69073.1 CRISPR-associated nuclease/helicase Cas3 subtype I-F/YPEST [Acinetobacter stercoris]